MTRMHTVELVCTVALALVLLASARDLSEDPILDVGSLVDEPAPTVIAMAVTSSASTGEVCWTVPSLCKGTACTQIAPGTLGSTTTMVKVCVTYTAPSTTPPSCCPSSLSTCSWPGISCTNSGVNPVSTPPQPYTTACASGYYLYTVHTSGRLGFRSGGGLTAPSGATACTAGRGFCVPLNVAGVSYGAPTIDDALSPVQIVIPRIGVGSPAPFVCKLGTGHSSNNQQLYCA